MNELIKWMSYLPSKRDKVMIYIKSVVFANMQ
jgi:hypothetical protein